MTEQCSAIFFRYARGAQSGRKGVPLIPSPELAA
jgi:hypothetical protein